MGRWSPAGLGPEKAALLGAVAIGDSDMVRFARITLCVAVGLGPGDAFLLASPRVVIGGVTDVMVDEGVGFLGVRVHFIFAVATLGGQRTRGVSVLVRSGLKGTAFWLHSWFCLFQALDLEHLNPSLPWLPQCPFMSSSSPFRSLRCLPSSVVQDQKAIFSFCGTKA